MRGSLSTVPKSAWAHLMCGSTVSAPVGLRRPAWITGQQFKWVCSLRPAICIVRTSSDRHPSSYSVDTEGLFPGDKVVGAWNCPATSCSEGFKNACSYVSTLLYAFVELSEIKYQTLFYLVIKTTACLIGYVPNRNYKIVFIRFVMFVCVSVCILMTNLQRLKAFLWKLIFWSSTNMCKRVPVFFKIGQ
jgi:hypothetical protein